MSHELDIDIEDAFDELDRARAQDIADRIARDVHAAVPGPRVKWVDKKMKEVRAYLVEKRMADTLEDIRKTIAAIDTDALAPEARLQFVHMAIHLDHIRRGGFAREDRSIVGKEMPLTKGGSRRTCMADAFVQCALLLRPDAEERIRADHNAIRRELQGERDPSMLDLRCLGERDGYGIDFKHVNQETPKRLVQRRTGVFLVMLRLTYVDGDTDSHAVVFDGATRRVLDNKAVRKVDDRDGRTNRKAIKAFHLWKHTRVNLDGVHEARVRVA